MPKKKSMENEVIYCSIRKCTHTECVHHHINIPWNKLILRKNFNQKDDEKCKFLEV